MIINNSPDISLLEVKVLMDLSGTNPVIALTNQSEGDNLSALTWVLNVTSPSGTPIYSSSFDDPFKIAEWSTDTIINKWPRPYNRIEWSGAAYNFEFIVRDSQGNEFILAKNASICKPVGNSKNATNTYGSVDLMIQTLCERAGLYIVDDTSKTYQGVVGRSISSYLAVDYPRDPTGTLPAPYTITSFDTAAIVPFSYNGEGYKASYYTIWEYGFPDSIFVRIRYVSQKSFDVQCNIDLCPLTCEIDKYIEQIESGNCENVDEARQKLFLINAKFNLAVIAKMNPGCGLDLGKLINEIKEIGGFDCDCSSSSTGIGSRSALVDGVNFTVVSEGGDIDGRFEGDENNVTLYLNDKSYTFSVCDDSATEAFDFKRNENNSNVDVCLLVKKSILAQELLITIKEDADLTNLFNSIVKNGVLNISVDGKCIISTNPQTSYTWTLTNIPSSPNVASLVSIANAGIGAVLSYTFSTTNLSGLQVYLNSLNIGSFTVTAGLSGEVIISSLSNPNNLSLLTYNIGSGNLIAPQESIPVSVGQFTVAQVVQAIINYLCALTDEQVKTSQEFSVPTIVVNNNGEASEGNLVVDEGTELTQLLTTYIQSQNAVIEYVLGLKGLSCKAINDVFPQNTKQLSSNTNLYGNTVDGCVKITPIQLFQFMLGNMDATTKSIFCEQVISCGAGLACEPYNYFELIVTPHSDTCPTIIGIEGEFIP